MKEWHTGQSVLCMMYRRFQDGGSNKDWSMVIRPVELKIEAVVKKKTMMRRQIDKKDDPSLPNMRTFLPKQPSLL